MMRADVPKEFLKKYASMDNVKFISKLPSRDHVFELFKNADIFVMPSMMEGFGYVYLEAMNFGLPVVALKIHSAIREIVDDGKTGYLVEPEVSIYNPDYTFRNGGLFWGIDEYEQPRTVDGLVEKLSRLIEDEALRRRMGREGKKEIERGKFSIGERNEKLKRIYEEAIKK
jgi:glycosyltransferase involved in cell wall biosynthesis